MVAIAGSYAVAVQRPVPEWELRLAEWINDVPAWIADVLHPIMQLGTLGGPVVVAVGIAAFRRDWLLSGATVVAGLATWFGAKGVKRVVERDRPLGFLPDIVVREGDGSGLGYVSGHSAVAATAALLAASVLPGRWKLVPAGLAFLVGIARVVHGVHLPADLVGGWAMGVLIGLATLALVDVVRRRMFA
jgi:undecaprenyl-diphosphatase